MTLSELGDLGDFIGGAGVIVTLAYLAVQIRRNTHEVRAASLDSVAASHMNFQTSAWSVLAWRPERLVVAPGARVQEGATHILAACTRLDVAPSR